MHFFLRDSKRKDLKKTGVIDKFGNLNPLNDLRVKDKYVFTPTLEPVRLSKL